MKVDICSSAGLAPPSASGEEPFCNGWFHCCSLPTSSANASPQPCVLHIFLLRKLALHRDLHGRRSRYGSAARNHRRPRVRRARLEHNFFKSKRSVLRHENRRSRELHGMVRNAGVRGLASNPICVRTSNEWKVQQGAPFAPRPEQSRRVHLDLNPELLAPAVPPPSGMPPVEIRSVRSKSVAGISYQLTFL
jgi:hypothetical protein